MDKTMVDSEPALLYPVLVHRVGKDGSRESEEYEIPDSDKAAVLEQLYPFENVPGLDEQRFDIHAGKLFTVRDFKVVREGGLNYLVSPYYYEGGGSVIDWFPANAEGQV